MIHASIIVLIIALMAGVTAVTISWFNYRQSRSKHLIAHLHFVISVNLIILLNIATLYFYQNLSSQASIALVLFVDNIYQILMPTFQVITVYSLYQLSSVLISTREPFYWTRLHILPAITIIVIQIILAILRLNISDIPVLYIVYKAVEIFSIVLAYYIIIMMLVKSYSVNPKTRGKSIRRYSAMFASIFTLALLISGISWLNWISHQVLTAAIAFLVLFSNLIPIFYYQKFLVPHFSSNGQDISQNQISIYLCDQFNISERENDVITLICEGRTNQEIADRLFISLQTVKDHVSRIFRKVGVRNRVQLISLVKKDPDTKSEDNS